MKKLVWIFDRCLSVEEWCPSNTNCFNVPNLEDWFDSQRDLWTLNLKLLIPEGHCVSTNTWIMKLFNGGSHIISDDKWYSVALLSSNLYLSDVEVRLINLTFLAVHQPFSSFNVRVPSKNFYNFWQLGWPLMNTGNCSVLGLIVDWCCLCETLAAGGIL